MAKPLTPAQQKFVDLEKKKADYKQWKQDLTDAITVVKDEIGLEGHFQDADGTVYQVVAPEGRFVYFDKVGYTRTRRGDEKRGDLSLSKAKELGYDLAK